MKKIAVIPSLLTLGNTFCGFLAVLKVVDAAAAYGAGRQEVYQGCLEAACLLVLLAMVFDALDGKVARMTKQATDFGAQLDSLSDAVTFGVAPAAMAKTILEREGVALMPYLGRHPRLVLLAAAVFALFAVMRLARFNVETALHEEEPHDRFSGLPTPAAGGFIVAGCLCWLHRGEAFLSELPPSWFDFLLRSLPWALVLLGLGMVSSLSYPHLIYLVLRRRKSFPFLAALVLTFGLATVSYETALFLVFLVYVVAGPAIALVGLRRGRGRGAGGQQARVLPRPRVAAG